jgi:hypothetical protein
MKLPKSKKKTVQREALENTFLDNVRSLNKQLHDEYAFVAQRMGADAAKELLRTSDEELVKLEKLCGVK